MEYPQSLVRLYQKGRFTVDIKPLFSYRQGTSILHKMPALFKIPLLFILNALVFFLPAAYCVSYALVCTVCARYAGFSFKQQLYDLKPVAGYALLLLCAHALSEALGTPGDIGDLGAFVLKLICAVQTTSLFFNTTTSLELKQALEKILPKTAAISFTLFLVFIPLLFSVWAQAQRAWKARAGKNGIKKLFVLLPVFISLSFYKAQNLFYSLQNRS